MSQRRSPSTRITRPWIQSFPVRQRRSIKALAKAGKLTRAIPPKSRVNLGAPDELGDDIIIKIKLKRKLPGTLATKKARGTALQNIKAVLHANIYVPIARSLIREAHKYTPQDTQRMLKSFVQVVKKSEKSFTGLRKRRNAILRIGAHVPYAAFTERMPATWLKHPHPWSTNKGRKGATLNDPKAQYRWYETLGSNARLEAKRRVRNVKRWLNRLLWVTGEKIDRYLEFTIPTGFIVT